MTTPPKPTNAKNTRPSQEGEPKARLPHERDESGDSADDEPRAVIKQAKADIDSGKQQTDRGEASDAAYQRQKEPKTGSA